MTSRQAVSVIVFAATLSACGSKDLSQDQAKGLLTDYFDKNPTTQLLLTGMAPIGTGSEAEYFSTPSGKYQKALESDGLISITPKGKIYNPDQHKQWFTAYDISLTDKGKKFVSGTPNSVPATWSDTWPTVYENVAFCGREITNIAGVTTSDDFSRVDYSWKPGKLTPFGQRFHEAVPEDTTCTSTQVKSASATFELHDGVWKVTAAQ